MTVKLTSGYSSINKLVLSSFRRRTEEEVVGRSAVLGLALRLGLGLGAPKGRGGLIGLSPFCSTSLNFVFWKVTPKRMICDEV